MEQILKFEEIVWDKSYKLDELYSFYTKALLDELNWLNDNEVKIVNYLKDLFNDNLSVQSVQKILKIYSLRKDIINYLDKLKMLSKYKNIIMDFLNWKLEKKKLTFISVLLWEEKIYDIEYSLDMDLDMQILQLTLLESVLSLYSTIENTSWKYKFISYLLGKRSFLKNIY